MKKILYILRGIPGSGKSTLAHQLTNNVVEADMFMYEDGKYNWSGDKLYMAHKKCFETVENMMKENITPIAVSNTFIKIKEYKPYVELANRFNYEVIIKICDGNYQNIHNVPTETIERMKRRFQV